MGPDRNTHIRNIAIVLVLAVAVWQLPGGGTGAATIGNIFSVLEHGCRNHTSAALHLAEGATALDLGNLYEGGSVAGFTNALSQLSRHTATH